MASSHAIEKDPTSRYARVCYLLIIAFIVYLLASLIDLRDVLIFQYDEVLGKGAFKTVYVSLSDSFLWGFYWFVIEFFECCCYLIVERGQVQSL